MFYPLAKTPSHFCRFAGVCFKGVHGGPRKRHVKCHRPWTVRPRAILTDQHSIFSGLIGLTYDTVGERAIESHLIPFAGCSRLRFFIRAKIPFSISGLIQHFILYKSFKDENVGNDISDFWEKKNICEVWIVCEWMFRHVLLCERLHCCFRKILRRWSSPVYMKTMTSADM